jgi:hypothetical protein
VNDPKRLIHGDDLGAELLGSAHDDVPRAGSRERAAAALGLAVGAAALTSGGSAGAAGTASIAPKAIGAAAGAGGSGAGAVAAKAAGGGILLKIVAGGAITMAVAGGAVAVKSKTSAPVTPPMTTVAPTTQPMSTANRAIPPPEPAKTVEAVPAPAPTETSPVVSAKTTTALRSPPAETELAKELRALDGARSALNRGDASGALAELDKHDRAFPTGPLRMEAAVMRAEALLARGDTARAKKLASHLLARDPNGPFARRLRTIADGS